MRRFVLVVIAVTLLRGAAVHAANYVQTDGTVVDPILDTSGGTHSYSGNDLEGGEDLRSAILTHAQLTHADLTLADLTLADLNGAELANATLAGVRFGRKQPSQGIACPMGIQTRVSGGTASQPDGRGPDRRDTHGRHPNRRHTHRCKPASGIAAGRHAQPTGNQRGGGDRCEYLGGIGASPGRYRGQSFGYVRFVHRRGRRQYTGR